jgi:hypothetical protein
MNKFIKIFLVVLLIFISDHVFCQVGIGTSSPHASAVLEIQSDKGGLLIPRMTVSQFLAIENPAAGLMVFLTDYNEGTIIYVKQNGSWEVQSSSSVSVPGSPTSVTAIAGDQQATVSFTAPDNNGGSAITSYTVISSPEGITSTIEQAESGFVIVSGLTNDIDYTFTVTANNTFGSGTASDSSNSIRCLYNVGDYAYGGVVFYVADSVMNLDNDDALERYLICSIKNQSIENVGIAWNNGSFFQVGANGETIETGANNTDSIINAQGDIQTDYAAGLARAYQGGGYTDWFLPSRNGLEEMYNNKIKINTTAEANGGKAFTEAFYWSSTEKNIGYAEYVSFHPNTGNWGDKYKDFSLSVRAIRAQ